jgi:prolyl oligopeptidase PreP (S9A serine peptidase family)
MVKSNHALWLWGFNISLTPSFSTNAVWMENGAFTLY